jgi:16S rRNA (cytosine1402-N4)-methyltransferase
MEFSHVPVMLTECIDGLNIKNGGLYLDGTLGLGGHSEAIIKACAPNGRLLAIDKDSDALMSAGERLSPYMDRITFIHDDFKNAARHIAKFAPDGLDGAILDLGVSSMQLDNLERGFSYKSDTILDMRMNRTQYLTAFNVVNEYTEYELAKILFEYGEERYSRRIAQNIVKARSTSSIRTTGQLAEIIEKSIPAQSRFSGGHPAKRTFQAIRIEVNGELDGLSDAVTEIAMSLKKGGRMCVITFHSLEDRIVKNAFRELEKDCICDKSAPICVCNKRQEVKLINKKPIEASKEELAMNKRSASAKLRIIERV